MNMKNDSYLISIGWKTSTSIEHYYRDESGWVKVSTRGRMFRATAEQVLSHVLPAIAGLKPGVTIRVDHTEGNGRDLLKPKAGKPARRSAGA